MACRFTYPAPSGLPVWNGFGLLTQAVGLGCDSPPLWGSKVKTAITSHPTEDTKAGRSCCLRGRRYRAGSGRALNPLGHVPAHSIEYNFTVPLQILLCISNVVFPFLAKVYVADDAVHGVITKVRMYQLN